MAGAEPLPFSFMDHCWILIGMMGAGKSSVGRALADLSGRPFWDTDQMLQIKLGRSISQIFQVYGEDAFRDHETCLLKSLTAESAVLSTGGGIVLREANWSELARLGTTIYLRAKPDTLIERLESSKKKRPLLLVDDWQNRLKALLELREPLYLQADIVVDMDDENVNSAAEAVLNAIRKVESD